MTRPPPYRAIPRHAIKIDLPNTFQLQDYTCGPAALMAIFAYYGVGPVEEWDLEKAMRITKAGTDPVHLVRAAKLYRMRYREFRGMRIADVVRSLDARRPVLIMLQAWGERRSYANWWKDGHWIIAIGYDADVIYFEDPSLYGSRGYIRRVELDRRWHDVEGSKNMETDHYGIAIWKPGVRRSHFHVRAQRIG